MGPCRQSHRSPSIRSRNTRVVSSSRSAYTLHPFLAPVEAPRIQIIANDRKALWEASTLASHGRNRDILGGGVIKRYGYSRKFGLVIFPHNALRIAEMQIALHLYARRSRDRAELCICMMCGDV